MTSPVDLHAVVLAALEAIPHVAAHDGRVPKDLPADSDGRVFPYAVLWGSPGHTPVEARNLEGDADGALEWPVQVTVAAGDITWCLAACAEVRAALDGLRFHGGVLHEEPGPGVRSDDDATPPRFYAPLLFRSLHP